MSSDPLDQPIRYEDGPGGNPYDRPYRGKARRRPLPPPRGWPWGTPPREQPGDAGDMPPPLALRAFVAGLLIGVALGAWMSL